MQKLKEECGVFGVYAGGAGCDTNLADTCYYGLFALQHRGQESCGIVINDDGTVWEMYEQSDDGSWKKTDNGTLEASGNDHYDAES